MDRIIVLGGKGGVGKSSISAATALLLSEQLPEKRILVISFDMAHNLSDLFAIEIGNNLTQLKENLWGIEPDPNVYAEEYTAKLLSKMKALMKKMPIVGLIPQIDEFIDTTFTADSIPLALKNAIFFQKILDAEDLTQEIQFDIIVADFPPTGNMIALFEIPEDQVKVTLKYSLEFYNSIKGAVKNISKMFKKVFNPFGDTKSHMDLTEELVEMFQELEQRGERITQLIEEIGSLRLVSIAEKPSFEEIKRARDLTKKYISLEGVHVNMLIPEDAAENCDFCESMRKTQQKYLRAIHQEFQQIKVWESNRLKEEPIGIKGLRELAREIYSKDIKVNDVLYP